MNKLREAAENLLKVDRFDWVECGCERCKALIMLEKALEAEEQYPVAWMPIAIEDCLPTDRTDNNEWIVVCREDKSNAHWKYVPLYAEPQTA